eukprot:4405913-Alexandrium_andersonii.AAC.1
MGILQADSAPRSQSNHRTASTTMGWSSLCPRWQRPVPPPFSDACLNLFWVATRRVGVQAASH